MQNIILDLPREASAQVNYMTVLASCENYLIPTCPKLSVEELISKRIYSWYTRESAVREQALAWFMNYE